MTQARDLADNKFTGDVEIDTDTLVVDSANNRVGIGTSLPSALLGVNGRVTLGNQATSGTAGAGGMIVGAGAFYIQSSENQNSSNKAPIVFSNIGGSSESMRIDSSGNLLVGKTSSSLSTSGVELKSNASVLMTRNATCLDINRLSDGTLVNFYSTGTVEGAISVSGTTVSYIGGHLSRWSQLADGTKDISIVKGTVMTNLDQMAVWSHDAVEAVEAQDAVYDDDGNVVTEAVEAVKAKDAYTEDNEQLNCVAVSSVEGDPNVAGVFVNWDNDDDEFNDINIAMTGDMVIRIAQGTTVSRGDLLMSAGDGTAKPQEDDIVRSKTIAKVTSTNISHTYDDGSYLVPCVLMAC